MVLRRLAQLPETRDPLELVDLPDPEPGPREVRIRVAVCGVCHTEIDEIEGRAAPPRLPVVLGHQIVGRIDQVGHQVTQLEIGQRVGVGWIHSACGACPYCADGRENLCERFAATGRDANGGYAELAIAQERFAVPLPEKLSDLDAAPLLCAGAIGYRSLRLAGLRDGQRLGLSGFGASAHLVLKMARHVYPASPIYVFARNTREQEFARELGADWAGGSDDRPPRRLHATIDTTPAWRPVLASLAQLEPGGRLVINAIRKEAGDAEALQHLDYPTQLWLEKEIKSVANVTRRDLEEALALAARVPIRPEVQTFRLEEANRALLELKERKIRGAKVLVI
jgi:propanol-preferring alcohol dehydrogenase